MSLVNWIAECFGWNAVTPNAGEHALIGYLALAQRPGIGSTLEPRMALLACALAAELSGCRWCIERTRHDWRMAGLSSHLLSQLRRDPDNRLFSVRERAALVFVAAITSPSASPRDIDRARKALSDNELAELTAIVAEHHCLETIDSNLPAS
jgi:alkylhydroperoxidase family enzyme